MKLKAKTKQELVEALVRAFDQANDYCWFDPGVDEDGITRVNLDGEWDFNRVVDLLVDDEEAKSE